MVGPTNAELESAWPTQSRMTERDVEHKNGKLLQKQKNLGEWQSMSAAHWELYKDKFEHCFISKMFRWIQGACDQNGPLMLNYI